MNYLMRIGFGKNLKVTSNGGGTSKISGQLPIPDHFSHGRPDAFDCVNFLSSFGDSVQVLKPDFIREEFKRPGFSNAFSIRERRHPDEYPAPSQKRSPTDVK